MYSYGTKSRIKSCSRAEALGGRRIFKTRFSNGFFVKFLLNRQVLLKIPLPARVVLIEKNHKSLEFSKKFSQFVKVVKSLSFKCAPVVLAFPLTNSFRDGCDASIKSILCS